MLRYRIIIIISLLMALLLGSAAAQAQVEQLVQFDVEAGFNGRFRENYWFPVRVQVRNDSDPLVGEIIVRPDTSGRVVSNAYSTPVDLPTGSEKTATLYLQARTFPAEIIVELLDEAGNRVVEREVPIGVTESVDAIYAVVTDGAGGTVNLSSVRSGGAAAIQTDWDVSDLPDFSPALAPLDVILLHSIDADALTVTQQNALQEYVTAGGHLIITGGANWRGTATALADLLPFTPDGTLDVDDFNGLRDYVGLTGVVPNDTAAVTTGAVVEEAQILASNADGVPLLLRRVVGGGLVDYLAVDPTQVPLSNWDGLNDLWHSLVAGRGVRPAWQNGYLQYNDASVALSILPGIELLPPVQRLIVFLVAYILLVGPVNYIVLSRINRRILAWVTIPLCIAVFSLIAWRVGFDLRGNQVILSRLSVVEVWPDSDEAHVNQLVGLLSPRRATYELETDADYTLRVLPQLPTGGFLAQNLTQSTAELVQTTRFSAQNVTVDGGIFANFEATGWVEAPDIGGSLTLSYNDDNTQSLQGVLRNDTGDITLEDAVIIARDTAYYLDSPLAPGDLLTIEPDDLIIVENDERLAPAAPLEYTYDGLPFGQLIFARQRTIENRNLNTIDDILGTDYRERRNTTYDDTVASEVTQRREALLRAIMRDQFGSPARGNNAYLVGWADAWRRDVDLVDVPWADVNTTMYIIQLDVDVDTDTAPTQAIIHTDQMTWFAIDRENIEGGPNEMSLTSNSQITLRFTPVIGAVLSQVDMIKVNIDRNSGGGAWIRVAIRNWETGEFEDSLFREVNFSTYEIPDATPYLGPNNEVDIRLTQRDLDRAIRVQRVTVSHVGSF